MAGPTNKMTNQTKYNKELLYSVILFAAANVIFFVQPFDAAFNVTAVVCFIFLLCAVYVGVISIKKASVVGERGFFGFVPNNIQGWLAFILTFVMSLEIIIVLIAFCYLTYPTQNHIHQKCPEEYASTDAGDAERLASMDKWTNDFYDANPGSTLSQWAEARHQFYIENNCTVALQRYDAAKNGTADPATMERIKNAIRK